MASVKIKFRPSLVVGKEGRLYYQVIQRRVARQIDSGYRILASEWDSAAEDVVLPLSDARRQEELRGLKKRVAGEMARLKDIVARLECTRAEYTSDEVVACFLASGQAPALVAFAEGLIRQLRQVGRGRTAETYATALNSFVRFRGGRGDVALDNVDAGLMMEYEVYLKSTGLCPNSCSFYMRNLRAIYNRAVEQEITAQRSPFRHVYTGVDKTVKRALPLPAIRRIRDLDLSATPVWEYARDMFMFSFYTRGMSFVDMAFLRKKDLRDGVLAYRRRKTGQQLFIRWEPQMQEIVERYDLPGSPFLLPLIRRAGEEERRQYRAAAHLVNEKLKIIGRRLELPGALTMYVARHAWASIAQSRRVPLSVISEGMGHDSENTTRIYLASLDTSAVDRANSAILKAL